MKKIIKGSIMLFLIITVVFVFYSKYNSRVKYHLAREGQMDDAIDIEGILFKDEYVTKFNSNSDKEFYYDEGSKISAGKKIAALNVQNYKNELREQIALIKNAEENADTYVVIDGEFTYYDDYSFSELRVLESRYESALSTGILNVYSSNAGIISYKNDGYENICKYDTVFDESKLINFDFSMLESESSLSDEKKDDANNEIEIDENTEAPDENDLQYNDFVCKVTRNFEYYLAVIVKNEDLVGLDNGEFVRVELDGEEEIYGQVYKTAPSQYDWKSILVLKFDDYFYKIYDKRIVDVKIITDRNYGVIVPNDSITKLDGMIGVYIIDISKIVKFLPIEILSSDNENTIVSKGITVSEGSRGTIYVDGLPYKTIMQYDNIVVNPSEVYDGEIIEREWSDDN